MNTTKTNTETQVIVVRGTVNGKYIRRTKHVKGTWEQGWAAAEKMANTLFAGMKTPFINIITR